MFHLGCDPVEVSQVAQQLGWTVDEYHKLMSEMGITNLLHWNVEIEGLTHELPCGTIRRVAVIVEIEHNETSYAVPVFVDCPLEYNWMENADHIDQAETYVNENLNPDCITNYYDDGNPLGVAMARGLYWGNAPILDFEQSE